ncbi:MAG: hypothetical protein K5905_04260 [Roseibium sp.]|uniref:HI1506-related protein n=1 Tax=Roseibium sp. TaxID=1936156 RepID=UPI002623D0F7|nr:HI1506-related protein [Roseibium sp.]MCV0424663.1 hypothetical protein [Roseibium sp.]
MADETNQTTTAAKPKATAKAAPATKQKADPKPTETKAATSQPAKADGEKTEAKGPKMVIRITAKPREGFRRCGFHHPSKAVDHPEGRFSADQIKVLKAEPNLVVHDL